MRARAAPPTPSRRAAQTPTSPVRRSARVAQAETGSAEPIGQQVEIEIPVTRARQTVLKQQPKRQSRARAAPEGAQAESEAEAERAEPVLRLGTPTPDDEEVQFYKDLNDYRSHSGDLEGFIPEINGKKLALWPLFSAATSQPVPHRDRDWRKVAETLGIDWRANEEILEQLERCYEQNLLDFEIKMREFEEGDDESSVEREDESSVEEADEGRRDDESGTEPTTVEVTVEQQETVESVVTRTVTAVPAGEASASKQPTPTSARKRAVDDEARIEPGAGSRGKRRRLSPQHETPQTPERHERQSKGKGKQKESATAFVEPETQDFRYDVGAGDEPETQDFGYVAGAAEEISAPSDDVEMTPSQQLRSEASAHRSSPAAQRQDGGAQRQPARANSPPSVDSSDEDAFDPPRMAIRGRTEPDQQPTRPRPAEQQQAQPKQPVLSPPAEITPASRPSPQREAVTAQSAAPASLQTTPPPREASASPSSGLDEYHAQVDHYVSLGYPYAIVRQAMLMTTFHPGPAAVVMEALRSGAPIPEARYIWTAQDDSALRAYVRARDDHKIRYPRDILVARRFERAQVRHAALVNKHGAAAVEERETFLRNLDAHEKEVERKAAAEARQSVSLARSEKDLKGLIASAVGPGVSGSLRRNG